MAGTFTHWMVVEDALDKYNARQQRSPLFPTLLELSHFVFLGAVGPDYPYLSELMGGFLKIHSWADRMHYENTGAFVQNGVRNLFGLNGDGFNICLSWLCGFATHLVTDSVIHPVVQAIVGPYIFNSGEHRHCELTQDSYIFNQIKGVELGYAEYAGLFNMCSDPNNGDKINPVLGAFWNTTLRATHPTASEWFDKIDPDTWHKNFLSKLSFAEDPSPIFRHFAEEKKLAYKKTYEITQDERQRFVDQVKLPGNRIGEFKKDAFDKAVGRVLDAWDKLFIDIQKRNPDGPAAYLKNWNLDTGVNEDQQYYW